MIKLIVAVRRNPAMTVDEFREHWKERHGRLVAENPATARYVRKYVQCHTLPEEYESGDAAFDGTAELWFDSVADKNAFFSDPDYLRDIQPDEAVFADMARTVFFVTREEAVIGDK